MKAVNYKTKTGLTQKRPAWKVHLTTPHGFAEYGVRAGEPSLAVRRVWREARRTVFQGKPMDVLTFKVERDFKAPPDHLFGKIPVLLAANVNGSPLKEAS